MELGAGLKSGKTKSMPPNPNSSAEPDIILGHRWSLSTCDGHIDKTWRRQFQEAEGDKAYDS